MRRRRPALAAVAEAWQAEARRQAETRAILDHTSAAWCDSLPDDPQDLYNVMGHFWDDGRKEFAPRLAKYQVDVWHDIMQNRFCLYFKAQKLGFSTFMYMVNLYKMLKTDRGNTAYIVAQNMDIAVMHLERLKDYMRNSPALRPYLVERPPRDEVGRLLRAGGSTKTVAVLVNPSRPNRPSHIYAKAIEAGRGLISHAGVSHIHMTDVSAAEITEERMEDNFSKTLTRLLNTRGSMVIESPPSLYPSGLLTRIGYAGLDECRKRGLGLDRGARTSALTQEQLARARKAGLDVDEPDGEYARDGRAYPLRDWLIRRLHWQVGVRDGTITLEEVEIERRKSKPLAFERLMEARIRTGENRAYDPGMAEPAEDNVTDFVNSFLESTGGSRGHEAPGGGRW